MRRHKPGSVIEVRWVDSFGHAAWDTAEAHAAMADADDAVVHRSVGYCAGQSASSLRIVQSIAGPMQGDQLVIPLVAIKSVKVLAPPTA